MGIMAYSLLWVMQDLYLQPQLETQRTPLFVFQVRAPTYRSVLHALKLLRTIEQEAFS